MLAIWPEYRSFCYSENHSYTDEFRALLREMEQCEKEELAKKHGGHAHDYHIQFYDSHFQNSGNNEWFTVKNYFNMQNRITYKVWWFSEESLPRV